MSDNQWRDDTHTERWVDSDGNSVYKEPLPTDITWNTPQRPLQDAPSDPQTDGVGAASTSRARRLLAALTERSKP